METLELINLAREAQEIAYAPYSKIKVGAALLSKSGKVYTGTNIENASYGLSICAERVAVFKAVSQGETAFEAIAITSNQNTYMLPCGACLQVLHEFADLNIIVSNESNDFHEYRLKEFLPQAFCYPVKKAFDQQEG